MTTYGPDTNEIAIERQESLMVDPGVYYKTFPLNSTEDAAGRMKSAGKYVESRVENLEALPAAVQANYRVD